jgi:protein-disulfide isomerase
MAARNSQATRTRSTSSRRAIIKPDSKVEDQVVRPSSPINLTNLLLFIAILLLVGIAFFVGALWQKVNNFQQPSTQSVVPPGGKTAQLKQVTLDQVKNIFNQNVVKFGDSSRRVLIVEFADPSCPYCHAAAGLDPELNNQMGANFKLVSQGGSYIAPVPEFRKLVDQGQASYAYVYYPGHSNGELAMKVLYCAYDQGKFWEAHDLLMTNTGYKLMNEKVKNDVTKLNLMTNTLSGAVDIRQITECVKSGKYDARLNSDMVLAEPFSTALGQNFGTPTFYVNASPFPGAVNYSSIKTTVDNYLK